MEQYLCGIDFIIEWFNFRKARMAKRLKSCK